MNAYHIVGRLEEIYQSKVDRGFASFVIVTATGLLGP